MLIFPYFFSLQNKEKAKNGHGTDHLSSITVSNFLVVLQTRKVIRKMNNKFAKLAYILI